MIISIILVLLIAISYPFVSHLSKVGNIFKASIPYQTKDCTQLSACAIDLQDRVHWFPPAGKYNEKDAKGHGGIILVDLETLNIQRLELIGFETFFQPHGLGLTTDPLNPNLLIIAVVNHGINGSSIEFFESEIGSTQATHYKTYTNSELLYAPNDVVPLDRRRFYASNDCTYPKGFMWNVERFLSRPWSYIVYVNENGVSRKVADQITYANGIALNTEGNVLFVSSTLGGHVHVYKRKESTGSLLLIDKVAMPMMPDNIFVDDRSIYVTGPSRIIPFLHHSKNISLPAPTIVVKMKENTELDLFYGKKYKAERVFEDDGQLISAGSITIVDSKLKKTLISGIFTRQVLICSRSL